MNQAAWGHLEDLPATWSDVDGENILTMKPNTQAFASWSDPGETDGKLSHHLQKQFHHYI